MCNCEHRTVSEDRLQSINAFAALYSEWLQIRSQLSVPSDLPDDELGALSDRESELVAKMIPTPVGHGPQVLDKLEVLERYHDHSDWVDHRDLRLVGSLKADLQACWIELKMS